MTESRMLRFFCIRASSVARSVLSLGAEQALEDRARIGLHRQRLIGRLPGERAAIGRAVAVLA